MNRTAQRRIGATLVTLAAALLAGGCVSTHTVRYGEVSALPSAYTPLGHALSVGDIVAALRAGRPQQQLAVDIRERGLLAPATGADIDLLLRSGAGSDVVDAVTAASAAGPFVTAPPTVVAAPVTIVPEYYGWYPWVPFGFGLWWYDAPRRYPPPAWHHRPPPRWPAPPPQWQGRPAPAPGTSPGHTLPGGSRQLKPGGAGVVKPAR